MSSPESQCPFLIGAERYVRWSDALYFKLTLEITVWLQNISPLANIIFVYLAGVMVITDLLMTVNRFFGTKWLVSYAYHWFWAWDFVRGHMLSGDKRVQQSLIVLLF